MKRSYLFAGGFVLLGLGVSSCSTLNSLVNSSNPVRSAANTVSGTAFALDIAGKAIDSTINTGSSLFSRFSASKTKKRMLDLRIGHTREEVLEIVGKPEKTEVYPIEDGKSAEIFFYRTDKQKQDSMISAGLGESDNDLRGFTPVIFEEGKVIGWGNQHYSDLYNKRRLMAEKKAEKEGTKPTSFFITKKEK